MKSIFSMQEEFILRYTGTVLEVIGVAGVVFTIYFDKIARGIWQSFGWLQLTGILGFLMLALFGVFVGNFLKDIKGMVEDYFEEWEAKEKEGWKYICKSCKK